VSAFADEVAAQIGRLASLWPALKTRREHVHEIESALMRHQSRLTAGDVTHGFDEVIANSPTTGWPPGPHEVLGCVLQARVRRVNGESSRKPRHNFGGLTFAQWWHTLPLDERDRHGALARMLGKSLPVDDQRVPLDCTESAGTPTAGDIIEWEAA
jgi:hypothetical protein